MTNKVWPTPSSGTPYTPEDSETSVPELSDDVATGIEEPPKERKRMQEQSRFRQYKGPMSHFITAIAVGLTLFHIAYILGLFSSQYIFLQGQAYLAMSLGLTLTLAFLLVPATKTAPRDKLPWYDVLLALGGLAGNLYIFFVAHQVPYRVGITTGEMVLGVITILVIAEATRRLLGLTLTIIVAAFIFYANFGNLFPGPLYTPAFSFERIVGYLWFFPLSIYGLILNITATIIAVFIIFAAFLQASGAGKFFVDLALAVTGRARGGPAKTAVIASGFFGTISGSAVANVVTTGMITIPLMKRTGYKPYEAGAIETVSSVGGQLMPPVMGAVAFILADFIGMSYWKVCIAAFLPALLYYVAEFWVVHFRAVKGGLQGLPRNELPSLSRTLKDGWHYLLPLCVLVYVLVGLKYSPETACMYALGALLLVAMLKKESRWTPKKLIGALEAGARGYMDVGVVAGAAGIIIGVASLTGIAVTFTGIATRLAGESLLPVLAVAAITSIILGMGLPSTPCYILLAIFVGPVVVKLGVPLIAAHLFIYYFGMAAHITPPVCITAFAAAGLAGASMMRTGLEAMRIGVVVYLVPFIFVYNPTLLMIGEPLQIALAMVTALIGVTALAGGLEGCLLTRLNWVERCLLTVGGIALIVPGWTTDIIGLIPFGVIAFRQLKAIRRSIVVVKEGGGPDDSQ